MQFSSSKCHFVSRKALYRILSISVHRVPTDGTLFSLVKRVKFTHVFFRQLEIVKIGVEVDSRWRSALWQWNETLLEGPPEENLGWVTVVLFSQLCYDRVVHLSANDGAIRLDNDIVLFAVVHYWFLLAQGVELYLIDGGSFVSRVLNFLKVLYAVVRYANSSDFTRMPALQESLVCLEAAFGTAERVVDEKEVDVVKLHPIEGFVDAFKCFLVSVVFRDAFGCDEYIPSIEARFSDGVSYSCLVLIHLGRVYVPVTSFEGF